MKIKEILENINPMNIGSMNANDSRNASKVLSALSQSIDMLEWLSISLHKKGITQSDKDMLNQRIDFFEKLNSQFLKEIESWPMGLKKEQYRISFIDVRTRLEGARGSLFENETCQVIAGQASRKFQSLARQLT
jgi:hypothetical protein